MTRRTDHAQIRETEGIPVGTAFNDAQRAGQANVFVQPRVVSMAILTGSEKDTGDGRYELKAYGKCSTRFRRRQGEPFLLAGLRLNVTLAK